MPPHAHGGTSMRDQPVGESPVALTLLPTVHHADNEEEAAADEATGSRDANPADRRH